GIRDRNVTGVQTCALPIYQRTGDQDAGGIGRQRRLEEGLPEGTPIVAPSDEAQHDPALRKIGDKRFGLGFRKLEPRALVKITDRSEERRVGKESRDRRWAQ